MKIDAMRKKTAAELDTHAAKLRTKIAETHKDRFVSESTDNQAIPRLKKELARTLTIAQEKRAEESKKD